MNGQSSSNTIPSQVQGICPTGWHIPGYAQWDLLILNLGGSAVAGGKLKSIWTVPDPHPRWDSPNVDAADNF